MEKSENHGPISLVTRPGCKVESPRSFNSRPAPTSHTQGDWTFGVAWALGGLDLQQSLETLLSMKWEPSPPPDQPKGTDPLRPGPGRCLVTHTCDQQMNHVNNIWNSSTNKAGI